jgi:hypothetical protein
VLVRAGDAKEEDYNDEIKNVDVGVAVGTGMTFDRLVSEARYTFGLTDVRGDEFNPRRRTECSPYLPACGSDARRRAVTTTTALIASDV